MLECKTVLFRLKKLRAFIIAYNSSMECTCNIPLQMLSFLIEIFGENKQAFSTRFRCCIKQQKQSGLLLIALPLLWYHQESNRGHKDFQSFALPTELWHLFVFFGHCRIASAKIGSFLIPSKFLGKKVCRCYDIVDFFVTLHPQNGK